jgi:ribosomal protein S18 acetylase RimI-like enzyme
MRSDWTTIACTPQERPQLAQLISRARWQHKHVDWVNALDMINQQPFLLALLDDEPIGCLACPPDPPGISWLRLFLVAQHFDAFDMWNMLWPEAESAARRAGASTAAVLLMSGWLVTFLMRSGFSQTNSVIFLERRLGRMPPEKTFKGSIREFLPDDLTDVVYVDNKAFKPLWQYSNPGMRIALQHSSLALVTEHKREITGYLLVSSSALGVHIARLAVSPSWQGRGIGSALVRRAMEYAFDIGANKLTVNTQEDNLPSTYLYHSLGFQSTSQSFPVWEKKLS